MAIDTLNETELMGRSIYVREDREEGALMRLPGAARIAGRAVGSGVSLFLRMLEGLTAAFLVATLVAIPIMAKTSRRISGSSRPPRSMPASENSAPNSSRPASSMPRAPVPSLLSSVPSMSQSTSMKASFRFESGSDAESGHFHYEDYVMQVTVS